MVTMDIRFIFTKGALEVLDYFTDQVMRGAVRHGIETYVVDISRPETYNTTSFIEYISKGNCAVFMFNQVGLLLTGQDGANIWEMYDIPVYDFIVDHPRSFSDSFLSPVRTLHVLTPDTDHAAYIKRFYPAIRDVHIMQHGGTEEPPVYTYEERDIAVLYVGDCQDVPRYPDIPALLGEENAFYTFCCTKLLEDTERTTEGVIEQYLAENGRQLPDSEIRQIIQIAAASVERTARRFYKQAAMQALDRAGIPVEVYGNFWTDENHTYGRHIHFHGRIPSAECNRLIGHARICLNIMPWFKNGSNERIYNTMLNGALCVIDESAYMKKRFQDGRELVFFNMERPEQLAADIRWLLEHPVEAAEIAKRGKAAVCHDTWADRFDELLFILEEDKGK